MDESFVDSVAAGLAVREFERQLIEFCRSWRVQPSNYVIENAVSHFVSEGDSDALYALLTDPSFLERRRGLSGANAVRADVQRGLNYFSTERPDVQRYLRIAMQQHVPGTAFGAESPLRTLCDAYGEFLQLNVPAQLRRNKGIHRALHAVFPLKPRTKRREADADEGTRAENVGEDVGAPVVRLLDYELGEWRCRCGRTTGHGRRFEYSCRCGAVSGAGSIDEHRCRACDTPPRYRTCSECLGRPTLSCLHDIDAGLMHPSEMQLPLNVKLAIDVVGSPERIIEMRLLDVPLLLGLAERNGVIVFDPPATFWGARSSGNVPASERGARPFRFRESPRYDGRTDLCDILEAVFRRTARARGKGHSLYDHVCRALSTPEGTRRPHLRRFTAAFLRRLVAPHNRIAEPLDGPLDYVKGFEFTLDCIVAAGAELQGNMAIVDRRLAEPGRFGASSVVVKTVSVMDSRLGRAQLTPTPAGIKAAPWLEADGIVRIGETVRPGQILVGMQRPRRRQYSPEEKLLRAIFGEPMLDTEDCSLRWLATRPGRILEIAVAATREAQSGVADSFGRRDGTSLLGTLLPNELIRISISIAVDQPLSVGDRLLADDGSELVVCAFGSRATLSRLDSSNRRPPDLVVAPTHQVAPAESQDLRAIRLFVRGIDFVAQQVGSRGIGFYTLVRDLPIEDGEQPRPTPTLTPEDFDVLLASGARRLVRELIETHYDCADGRRRLYEAAVRGSATLHDLVPAGPVGLVGGRAAVFEASSEFALEEVLPGTSGTTSLCASRSGSIRYLGALLRCLGFSLSVTGTVEPRLIVRFLGSEEIRRRSRGQVTSSSVLDATTGKAVPGGLYCQKIFGPIKDYECACGELKRMKHRGQICNRCGVECTTSQVRRTRTAHIELPVPVVNPLLWPALSDTLAKHYRLNSAELHALDRFEKGLVFKRADGRSTPCIVDPDEGLSGTLASQFASGGEAIRRLIAADTALSSWRNSMLTDIEVLPPILRPSEPTYEGTRIHSELNDLYGRLIDRAKRLRRLMELGAPAAVVWSECLQLRNSVEGLFTNSAPVPRFNMRPLHSLRHHVEAFYAESSALLDELLPRHLDYCAVTRVTAAETEGTDEAWAASAMLFDIFRPRILGALEEDGAATNIKAASREIEARSTSALRALDRVCRNAVMLVVLPDAPRRAIAVRPRPWDQLTLGLHPRLLSALGWDRLGRAAHLFAVLTTDAALEAWEALAPVDSRTRQPSATELARTATQRMGSALSWERSTLLSEIAKLAITGETPRLTDYDQIVTCIFPPPA